YGESKMEAEKILLKMYKEYGFPLTIARPTGVIGPGESYLFNDIIIAIDKGLALLPRIILGTGRGTIHWIYIDDIIQGFLRIIENPKKSIGQIYNLASDSPQTWNDLIETICESLGKTGRIFHVPAILGRIGLPLFTLYYKLRGVDNFVLRAGTVKAM
ncbi:MAG: NAD-dependent epimerase/dehydratase family protein, partial [Candidatus Hodarchaeota archaeon]